MRGIRRIRSFCLDRAQVSIDFLMTYGLAMLLILGGVGVLLFSGVLNLGSLVPESCEFPSLLDCRDFAVSKSGVGLSLLNRGSDDMIVKQISVSSNALDSDCHLFCGGEGTVLGIGEEKDFGVLLGGLRLCGYGQRQE